MGKRPADLARIGALVEGWLAENPTATGINWASSLELAFRAIAWTWTLHLTGTALPLTLRRRMVAALDLHGRHIERFLSTWFSPNTHLTGEALGLLYLGTAWPSLHRAARWRALGWTILREQQPHHLRPDGTYFEQSSWYLGYSVDFCLHALRLARAQHLPGVEAYTERTRAACEALHALVRPDGTLPLLGDDDGGRLLPLGSRPPTSFADSLTHASHVLDCPVLRAGLPAAPETIWLTGVWSASPETPAAGADPGSRALRDGGWFILRGHVGDAPLHVVLDAGPHGALRGAHAHADALSLDLTLGGVPMVSDPGTFSYLPPERDQFRGMPWHSTLILDECSPVRPAGPFAWAGDLQTRVLAWEAARGHAWLDGAHDGWTAVRSGMRHRRSVLLMNGLGLLILDQLSSPGREPLPQAAIRWHTAPDLRVALTGSAARLEATTAVGLWLRSSSGVPLDVQPARSSRCYGRAAASHLVVDTPGQALRGGVLTLIQPDGPIPPLTPETTEPGAWALRGEGIHVMLHWQAATLRWRVQEWRGPSTMPPALDLPSSEDW